MSGSQKNGCGQQCTAASIRGLTINIHQQEHYIGMRFAIRFAISDGANDPYSA